MTKSQQIYPTDLNDTQWLKIRPYLPAKAQTDRPQEHGWRIILNSIFYILQSGCAWRMLPIWQDRRLARSGGVSGRAVNAEQGRHHRRANRFAGCSAPFQRTGARGQARRAGNLPAEYQLSGRVGCGTPSGQEIETGVE